MLNPSTADANRDDPTIRRCIDFAQRWGYGGLLVGNLFAYRSTDPKGLLAADDPVGPENDRHLAHLAESCNIVVAAWGAVSRPDHLRRATEVREIVGHKLYCLGMTTSGQPRHPLYVRSNVLPKPYAE